ncbi:hypothetical protein AB3G45_03025 [Shinella sp. S4-D37]|uniref:hypothetical protein n=1 Tax=Shinella sp. S4-D37 TaxID=3161999 RepID=UPI003466AF47
MVLEMQPSAGKVLPAFDAGEIERLVWWAQGNPFDYSYVAFSEKVKAAGCAGYLVSFLSRRSSISAAPLKLMSSTFRADRPGYFSAPGPAYSSEAAAFGTPAFGAVASYHERPQ